jgi:hypothetical protein
VSKVLEMLEMTGSVEVRGKEGKESDSVMPQKT